MNPCDVHALQLRTLENFGLPLKASSLPQVAVRELSGLMSRQG